MGKLNIIGIRGVGIPVLDSGILKGFVGTAMDVTSHQELMHELVRRGDISLKRKGLVIPEASAGVSQAENLLVG